MKLPEVGRVIVTNISVHLPICLCCLGRENGALTLTVLEVEMMEMEGKTWQGQVGPRQKKGIV